MQPEQFAPYFLIGKNEFFAYSRFFCLLLLQRFQFGTEILKIAGCSEVTAYGVPHCSVAAF